jgi:hypothetical protein
VRVATTTMASSRRSPDLAIKLRELRAVEPRMAVRETSRAAYLRGAEEHSPTTLGRPLTEAELDGVIAKFGSDGTRA